MTTTSPPAPPNTSTSVYRLEAVRFGYVPGRPVVEQVTASVEAGRLVVLIGPNAAGKSTLMRLMLGLHEPWDGQVWLGGRELTHLTARQRAAQVSYVPQRGGASFAFTVRQVVAMSRFAQPYDAHAVNTALEVCDLADLGDRIYAELSGGQQQRVLLARAMAQVHGGGRALLLDEPVNNLDLWHIHHTMEHLRDLATRGLAVLAVLHDVNLAARYADDVWLMDAGRLVAQGPWSQVLRPEVLEPVYRVSLRAVAEDELGRPVFLAQPSGRITGTPPRPGQ